MRAYSAFLILSIFAVLFALAVSIYHPSKTYAATTDSTINFQARLQSASGNIVPDGTYDIEFKLFDASSSSGSSQGSCSGDAHCLWNEHYTYNSGAGSSDARLTVINGYLSAGLGSLVAFPNTINWDQQLYLTMNIGGTTGSGTITWDGEMAPRLQLTALPYAFRAGSLALLTGSNTSTLGWAAQGAVNNSLLLPNLGGTLCVDNDSGCGFAPGTSASYIQNTSSVQAGANFNIGGAGTIGGTGLTFNSGSGATIQGPSSGLTVNTTSGNLTLSTTTSGNVSITSAGNITETPLASGGTELIGAATGTGNITLGSSSAAQSVLIGNGTGGSTVNIANGVATATGNSVTIAGDATATGLIDTVNIATGNSVLTGAKVVNIANGTPGGTGTNTVSIGSLTNASTTTIQGGTGAGAIQLQVGASGTISVGTTSQTSTLNLGNTSASATTLINGGTGGSAISLQAGTSGTISIGTTNVNTVTVGSTSNTGTLTFGQSTAGETINIGNGNVASGNINTINIGATATSTGKDVITLGSLIAASTTTIQGGTGATALALTTGANGGTAGTIQIGNTTGANIQAINIGTNSTGSSTNNVTIGSTIGGIATIQASGTAQTITGSSDTIKTSTNSTTAFQIQNTSGVNVLNADTTNQRVNIGLLSAPSTLNLMLAPTAPTVTPTCSLNCNTSYSYEIVAYVGGGAGTTGGATTSASPAGSTTGGAVSAAVLTIANNNAISWSAPTNTNGAAVAYAVYRTVGGGTQGQGLIGTTTNTTFTDTGYFANPAPTPAGAGSGSMAANTYYYEVTALDSNGGETFESVGTNNEASITTTATLKTVTLSWANIAGARAYKVYRSTTSGSEALCSTAYTNSFIDTAAACAGASPPSTTTGYANALGATGNGQLTVGSGGTPTSQLYVGGSVASAALGSVATGTNPLGIATQGNYTYVVNSANAASTLQIFNTSNPTNPVSVSTIKTGTNAGPWGIAIWGRYAYITNNSIGMLQVYDINNPSAPYLVSSTATAAPNPYGIAVQGRYAYVGNTDVSTPDPVQIFDVSNPANPISVGTVAAGGGSYTMTVQGRYLYIANFNSSAFSIYDVSNPSTPVNASSNAPLTGGTHPYGIAVSGNYVYVVFFGSDIMDVYDVSNPYNPVGAIGSVATGHNPNGIVVQGRYAYVSEYNNGSAGSLQTFDISNPTDPVSVGSATTANGAHGLAVQGRYAYVDNYTAGTLQTFDLGGAYVQQLQVGGAETGSLQVDNNETILGSSSIQGGVNIGQSAAIGGGLSVVGSTTLGSILSTTDLQTPNAPTILNVGTPGAGPTYTYAIVAVNANGTTAASATATTATGNTTLSATNYNFLSWSPVAGATNYYVYRTAVSANTSPTTTGKIAIVAANTNPLIYKDIGAAGDSTTTPVVDTTGSLAVTGVVQGGLSIGGLSTSATPTVTTFGTTGAQTWGYEIVAVNATGGVTAASAQGTTATANGVSTLTAANFQRISWTPVFGAVSYKIYRTQVAVTSPNPNTTGLIGTTSLNSFSDTGLAGDGTTAPATNTTGSLTVSAGTYGTYGASGSGTTITQSGTTITGSGTTFTSSMTGGTIYYNDGTTATLTYVSTTSLTSSVSKTISLAAPYNIVYGGFNVSSTGAVLLQPTVDSTTVFQVQNAAGTTFITGDSTNTQLILGTASSLNGKLAFATAGGGTMTINPTSSASNFTLTLPAETGTVCTDNATGAASYCNTAGHGYVQLAPNNGTTATAQADATTYSSIFINKTNATGNILELQKTASDVFTVANTGNITATGLYNTNTFTSTALTFAGASPVISASTSNTGLTLQANGSGTLLLNTTGAGSVSLGTGGNSQTVSIGNTTAGTTIAENVATSYTLNGVAASTYTIGAATTTGSITIGGTAQTGNLTLGSSSGTNTEVIAGGGGATTLQIANAQTAGSVSVGAALTSGSITVGGTSQTGASATTLQAGATSETLLTSGDTIKTTTNSATAFQIQNATANPQLNVNNSATSNLLKYPSFASGSFSNAATGWIATAPGTIAQNTTAANSYDGLDSLDLTTTSSNGGAQTSAFTGTVAAGTYYVSFYVMPGSAMNANAFTITLNDGSNHTCSPASQTLSTTSFIRVSCSAVTGANLSTLTIAQNDSTARTNIYISDVQLQSTGVGDYQLATLQLPGTTITNPMIFENASNSTTAFQIQNSSGFDILDVDTVGNQLKVFDGTSTQAYVSIAYNDGTSTGTIAASSGTTAIGNGTGPINITAGSSAAVTITANAASVWSTSAGALTLQGNGGLTLNSIGANTVTLDSSTTGTVNVGNGANGKTIQIGNNQNATTLALTGGNTSSAISLQAATSGSILVGTSNANTVTLGNNNASTVFSAESGTGTVNLFNGATAHTIQLATGGAIQTITIGSTNSSSTLTLTAGTGNVNIGTSGTTGPLLSLFTDTDATYSAGTVANAGTEVNGAMFYSTINHDFMCGVAGAWETCTGLLYSNTAASSAVNTCTGACTAFSTSTNSTIPGNYCEPGRTIHVEASGIYSTAAATTLAFGIYYGTSTTIASDTQIGSSTPATGTLGSSLSNLPWTLDYTVICYSTTSMSAQGVATVETATGTPPTSVVLLSPNTTTTNSLTTTTTKNLYIAPAWSVSNAGNTITAEQAIISGM